MGRILEGSTAGRKITLAVMDADATSAEKPEEQDVERGSLIPGVLAIALVALLLVGESLLPGRTFVPLTVDDFPAWQAGRDPLDLLRHETPNWNMSDVMHLLLPGLATTKAAFDRGELPQWDPSQALGVPHLDEVHYSVYYPPAWLPLWLGYSGLAWMAMLHLFVAGVGMLLYLAAIGRSRHASIAGALCFAFSAWIGARLHAFPVVGTAVWLPWILWGLERAATGGGRRHRVAAAAALAMTLLAGFPQVALWVLTVAVAVEAFRAMAHVRRCQPWAGALAGNMLALALGIALALPQLLPTLDYLQNESLRNEQTAEAVAADGLEWPLMWQLLVPDRYATSGLSGPNPLAMADMEQGLRPAALNRAETSMAVGVLGLLLALLAMLFGRGWRTVGFTAITLTIFTILLWPQMLREVASAIPLMRVGNPKRLLLISSFAMAVLAAGGLDLVRGHRLRVTVVAWLLAVAFTALAVVARINVPSTELPDDIDKWSLKLAAALGQPEAAAAEIQAIIPAESFRVAAAGAGRSAWIALALSGLCILLFRPKKKSTVEGWSTRARRSPSFVVCVLGLELIIAAWPMLRAAPTEAVTTRPDRIGTLIAPELAGVLRGSGTEIVAPPRIARFGNTPPWVRPNFPGQFGLTDLQCYAPMAPRRVAELLEAVEPGIALSGSSIGGFLNPGSLTSPVLDLLGVQALATDKEDLEAEGWSERGVVGHVRVLNNDEVLPRAMLVHELRVIGDADRRLRYIAGPTFDPASVAVLESDPDIGLIWEDERAGLGRALPPLVEPAAAEPEAVGDDTATDETAVVPADDGADEQGGEGGGEDSGEDGDEDGDEDAAATVDDVPDDAPEAGPDVATVSDDELPPLDDGDDGGAEDGEVPADAGPTARHVAFEQYQPGRMVVRLGEGDPGLLVLAEGWHAGWRASTDSATLTVLRADHALLAVPVETTEETLVTFTYEPPIVGRALLAGAVSWGIALLLLVPLPSRSRRRRR